MNKLVKDQLDRVSSCELSYDSNTIKIFIPKTTKIIKSSVEVGSVYLISLSSQITNPTSNSTLSSNWNQGRIPIHNLYISEIVDKIPGMIKINGVSKEDQTDNFYGWLPIDQIEIEEKL